MDTKLIIALCVVVVGVVYAQDKGESHKLEEYIDYHAPPKYHYDYHVHDLKKHDIKSQWETRDHHKVKGSYSLLQPDHRRRIVDYEGDKNGIRYRVRFEGGHYGSGI